MAVERLVEGPAWTGIGIRESAGLYPLHVEGAVSSVVGRLFSRDVLDLSWVTTNAGALDEDVVFDPLLLLSARHTRMASLWVEA